MNFDFSETQKILCEKVKGVFDTDSKANLAKLGSGDDNMIRIVVSQWLKTLGQVGYLTLGLENGKEAVGLVAAQESLAKISPSLFLSVDVNARIFGRLIAIYGTLDQKSQLLPALKEGRLIGTVALSEGGMNIENNPLNTTGVPVGDGFLVTGAKCHVVNGPIADWIAIAGKVGKNIVFFLIKKDSEGLSIGQRLPTLGYNGTAISAISLENCPVPLKYLGLMQRCYNAALSYAKTHKSGGKPIIAYQEVGFKLAEILTLLQTAQLLAYRAAWMAETAQLLAYRAAWMAETGDKEISSLAHCAKVFCTESAEIVASQALQILGGYGYIGGNPAEEGYRSAKYLQIAGTSTEISRMKIADGILGMG
jgi:alkylation response protein AidB-like acyl-CoA dehydrogenase